MWGSPAVHSDGDEEPVRLAKCVHLRLDMNTCQLVWCHLGQWGMRMDDEGAQSRTCSILRHEEGHTMTVYNDCGQLVVDQDLSAGRSVTVMSIVLRHKV
jgi:hypothetical protein